MSPNFLCRWQVQVYVYLYIFVHPVFNRVAPYGFLFPTVYLLMADITNPDLVACNYRSWICIDITRHLRNKEAKRSLKVVCNETELENTTKPKYIGVTSERSLSYIKYKHKDEGGYPKQPTYEIIITNVYIPPARRLH